MFKHIAKSIDLLITLLREICERLTYAGDGDTGVVEVNEK